MYFLMLLKYHIYALKLVYCGKRWIFVFKQRSHVTRTWYFWRWISRCDVDNCKIKTQVTYLKENTCYLFKKSYKVSKRYSPEFVVIRKIKITTDLPSPDIFFGYYFFLVFARIVARTTNLAKYYCDIDLIVLQEAFFRLDHS